MKRYLSFGGGVNSTALLLLLTDEGVDFEAVFVNHGTDYPETYEYVEMLREKGYPITEVRPQAFGGYDNLYDYCTDAEITPVRIMRWCTDHFKIRPLMAYYERPCVSYIGIDADEERRVRPSRVEGVENVYPLVDRGIGRDSCIDIIKAHDLPVPPKSGCFICPFQRRSQWIELNRDHPDLWCKAVTAEQRSIDAQERRAKDGNPVYLVDRPLPEVIRAKDGRGRYAKDDQEALFDDRRPCQCGL